MGEYAEMMLDGTCCSSCGEYLDDSLGDFPQQCAGCEGDLDDCPPVDVAPVRMPPKTVACPCCSKKFYATFARDQHIKAKAGNGDQPHIVSLEKADGGQS